MNPKKLITFLFSLLAEGYTTENASDKEGMMVILKTGRWITAKDIGNTLNDIDAISAIQFYQRYKRMGMPYGPWGITPEKLVEVVDILESLDRFYHP